MALDRRIVKAAVLGFCIGTVLIVAVILAPKPAVDRLLHGPTNDTLELINRSAEFAAAIRSEKAIDLYRLFNSSFRDEVPLRLFDSALKSWRGGREVNRVATTHVEIQGMSGLISTHVYFRDADTHAPHEPTRPGAASYDFLFQTWLRAPAGWQLMWISKILDPVAMDYGRRDSSSLREILQLALDEIITRQGIEKALGITNPSRRLILVSHGIPLFHLDLPGKQVVWLARDSIDFYQRKYGIEYYIEVLPLRVLNDIAVGAFDVVPVSGHSGAANGRTRGIKLFFRRTAGKWGFINYGSHW
jgi:hypothetical protein